MTEFSVVVCLPPTAPGTVHAAVAAALAPYDFNATPDGNPAGEWDRWIIDRDPAVEVPFRVLPAHDGDPRLLTAARLPADDVRPLGPLECHGGPRGLLDFTGMRREAALRHEALAATREEAIRTALPGFALVTLEGEWIDADDDGYWERVDSYLDRLPAETVVVGLACHC
ncbi:hypothetical protein [Streptomyces sp. NPDC001978]|uniref:hypothetical protein n=1 Tax=Streptomyces sp. NPDC001978 TaxID=3364627 RepID=UPI003697B89B